MDAETMVARFDEAYNNHDRYVAALDLVSWLGDSERVWYDNSWRDAGDWLLYAFINTTTDEDAFETARRLAEWCAERDASYWYDRAWRDAGYWWVYAFQFSTNDSDARVMARRVAEWSANTGNNYWYDRAWRGPDYWRSLS